LLRKLPLGLRLTVGLGIGGNYSASDRSLNTSLFATPRSPYAQRDHSDLPPGFNPQQRLMLRGNNYKDSQ